MEVRLSEGLLSSKPEVYYPLETREIAGRQHGAMHLCNFPASFSGKNLNSVFREFKMIEDYPLSVSPKKSTLLGFELSSGLALIIIRNLKFNH